MAIRLETSKARAIDNHHDSDISSAHLHWCKSLGKRHPGAKQRTSPSPRFNCHGLTFAARRTKVLDRRNIERILKDDEYEEVGYNDLLPGDVVLYFGEDGDPNHSGIVVEIPEQIRVPKICSKWGVAGEYIHSLNDVPELYGPIHKFYRCKL